jgi:hypothetical protein
MRRFGRALALALEGQVDLVGRPVPGKRIPQPLGRRLAKLLRHLPVVPVALEAPAPHDLADDAHGLLAHHEEQPLEELGVGSVRAQLDLGDERLIHIGAQGELRLGDPLTRTRGAYEHVRPGHRLPAHRLLTVGRALSSNRSRPHPSST